MDTETRGSINVEGCDVVENEEEVIDDSEERELVTDSCATKVLDPQEEPTDRYRVVYFLFYLFGISSLVPWNFLITANDYWMYKFRDTTPKNLTVLEVQKTQFQAEFTSYLNVATAIPNLIFLILNSLFGHLVPMKSRLQGSLVVVCICFLVTTSLVQVDTDNWQNEFFIVTMVTVVIMTAASAVFIGGLVGIASRFSKEYMAAVVSGQSLGGIIAAIAQIISLAFKISPLHSALIYFIIADIMVVSSLISYALLYKIDFFTYHLLRGCGGIASNRHREVSMVSILKKIWVYAIAIFAVFAISMAVYPAVTVLVESHPVTKGTDWNNIYFVPVVNYLIFNCGDYSGRLVAGFLQRPNNQWLIACSSFLRVVGVPMLMLCNAQPRSHLPVLFLWDWEYIIIMIVFAFTNGYLTNIIMINSTRVVEMHEREKASSVIATMLSVGLTVGAAIGMLLVRLL
ncbi:equilibrative nucleoside transporter 1 [Hyposmocoma kahamanoa]|uniref:equilibrative nucleoside transporter 1 n=1 Tax=Hyposmocoma kahamanoa TaxID=1477025 RepID=UPI000E6D5FD0|nr:equilibrative nucleoside transporter 1 [Hyposmocoma kahamanoa]